MLILYRFSTYISCLPDPTINSETKVYIELGEGHKIWRNLPLSFDVKAGLFFKIILSILWQTKKLSNFEKLWLFYDKIGQKPILPSAKKLFFFINVSFIIQELKLSKIAQLCVSVSLASGNMEGLR